MITNLKSTRRARRRTRCGLAISASGCLLLTLSLGTTAAMGAGWIIQPAARATGGPGMFINGVSCVSRVFCTAVGGYTGTRSGAPPLSEHWDGVGWGVQPTPSPVGSMASELRSVSCVSVTACTAVGDADQSAMLAEEWDGLSWSIERVPNPPGPGALQGVSCPAPNACIAVGGFTNERARRDVTLAERWDGTKWSIQRTPNPASASASNLMSVSCTSATSCIAVGTSADRHGSDQTITERWNGRTWSIQRTAMPAGASGGELFAVSCNSARACAAVGFYTHGRRDTLVEHWNGSRWSTQPSPNQSTATGSLLEGVSCTSPKACIAVGDSYGPGANTRTLAERWNGTNWSIQRTPNPSAARASNLTGISCVLGSGCTAIGSFSKASGSEMQPLIERNS